jgi:hypothetical protein
MRLGIVRQRYTPFGGAERFVERAIDALIERGVQVRIYTRKWPQGGDRRVLPVLCDPFYVGSLWRDRSFAGAVQAALAQDRPDLVQSHERIEGCNIFRAGDGVHRVWLEERLRTGDRLERARIAANPYHRYILDAEARARGRAGLAHAGIELARIDGVVDHVQLVVGEGKVTADVVADHVRNANDRFERRVREDTPFRGKLMPVKRVGRDGEPLRHAARPQPLREPRAMDAVAGAEDVAAGDPLMRLYDVGTIERKRVPYRPREARIAPDAADVVRIADDGLDAPRLRGWPRPRVHAHFHAAPDQRVDRALDKALRAAEGRIALPNDPKPHRGAVAPVSASSETTAAATESSGNVNRQSELLLPPQPLLWQGRHAWTLEVTTRCGTRHGPQMRSSLGPNQATIGVPAAEARCIGAVSQPMNRRADAINADSSAIVSRPARSTIGDASAALIALTSGASAGSGAPVMTSGQPIAASRSSSAAVGAAGQHLNSQREPG